MKKLLILLLAAGLTSCSLVLEEKTFDTTFVNNTSYTITVSDYYGNDFDSFTIASGKTKTIASKSEYDTYTINGPSTVLYDYSRSGNTVTIYQFNNTVVYELTGTATSVDVTLANSVGGTEQYDNVTIPFSYTYKYFPDSFLYISAQNQGVSGSVTVRIYLKGSMYKSSTSQGAYGIATASGTK